MAGGGQPLGRLTRRPDFLAAAKGRRFHTGRMTVQGLVRPGGEAAEGGALRFGLTVTKRVGHATERNRIKRRLRSAIAQAGAAHAAKHVVKPADVVVVARRDCLAAPFPVLVEDLGRALVAVIRPRAARDGAAGQERRSPEASGGPAAN